MTTSARDIVLPDRPAHANGNPFDALAGRYDAAFSATSLGRLLREAVHEEVHDTFRPGDRVIELGCGTGEDAIRFARRGVYVCGVDASERMVDLARAKAAAILTAPAAGRRPGADEADAIATSAQFWTTFHQADLNFDALPAGPFDGAFSNFGVLNCIRDRRAFAARLADVIEPGGPATFVVMGRYCPWEWLWFAARGRARAAVRRLGKAATFRGMQISYPTPRVMAAEFGPFFKLRRVAGIGVLLPPTFASALVQRHVGLAVRLAALERRIRRRFPATLLNDHYLIHLERR